MPSLFTYVYLNVYKLENLGRVEKALVVSPPQTMQQEDMYKLHIIISLLIAYHKIHVIISTSY